MTTREALAALFNEFHIEEFIECVRDEAKYDETFRGLSSEHPRVQRFREVCQVLREQVTAQ